MNNNSAKLGIAFIKGLNMFGNRNIDEKQVRKALSKIEARHSSQVKFVGVYGQHNDIIVFKKLGVQYATVGSWIELELKKILNEDVHVTTRSMKVVKGVVEKF